MKLFRGRCVSAHQVLDSTKDLTFRLASRDEFQPKIVNKKDEYEYVQREFGYDSVPPSQHVPSHSIDTEDLSQPQTAKEEPNSDISGSESDAIYVAGSGRFHRNRNAHYSEPRKRDHLHNSSFSRHSSDDIIHRTRSRTSRELTRRDGPCAESSREDPSTPGHTKPVSSKRDALSDTGHYRPSHRYTGPGSATEARSTGAIEAIYTSSAIADLREMDENDKEFPVIDRVPTAFGYVSEDSGVEEDSRVSRYTVDENKKAKRSVKSAAASSLAGRSKSSKKSARVSQTKIDRESECDDEDDSLIHEDEPEVAVEEETPRVALKTRTKSVFSESTLSYDDRWRKDKRSDLVTSRMNDIQEDEDDVIAEHPLIKTLSRRSKQLDDDTASSGHHSIKPKRSKGDPPGFDDFGAASRRYSSHSMYRESHSRQRDDRNLYDERHCRHYYNGRGMDDERDNPYYDRDHRRGQRSREYYDDEEDFDPRDHDDRRRRRYVEHDDEYGRRSHDRRLREYEHPSPDGVHRHGDEHLDATKVQQKALKNPKETKIKKGRGLFGRILGDKVEEQKPKEIEPKKGRGSREKSENDLPTSIERLDGLSVQSEISYDKSSLLKRSATQQGKTRRSNSRERPRARSRSASRNRFGADDKEDRRRYKDEPLSPDASIEPPYAAPYKMKKSSSSLPFESSRSPAPALRFNPHSRRQVPVSKSMSKHFDRPSPSPVGAARNSKHDPNRRPPSRAKSLNVTSSKSRSRFMTSRTSAYYE